MTENPTPRDKLIAEAKDVPSLIAAAQQVDPALAQALSGKALLASKSVYGPAATLAVTCLVGRYGLGWDSDTIALVSGLLVLIVSAALRWATTAPITGLFRKGTPK